MHDSCDANESQLSCKYIAAVMHELCAFNLSYCPNGMGPQRTESFTVPEFVFAT